MSHRGVERRLGHAHRTGADAGTEEVERPHRDAEPVIDVAEHVPPWDEHGVEAHAADRVVGDEGDRRARQPGAVAWHHECGDPSGARAGGGAGEDGVDVGVGRVGDECLLARESEAVAVALCGEAESGDVRPGAWLGDRERRHRLTGADPGDPLVDDLRTAGREDGVRAQALEGECRLGGGAIARQPLPNQAQLEGGDRSIASQHGREQPVRCQRGDERPVDRTRLPAGGDRGQDVAGQSLASFEERPLLLGQVRVGRAHGITATPTSSTRARGSKSSVTPITAIAG